MESQSNDPTRKVMPKKHIKDKTEKRNQFFIYWMSTQDLLHQEEGTKRRPNGFNQTSGRLSDSQSPKKYLITSSAILT
jgi:hypothetical protein